MKLKKSIENKINDVNNIIVGAHMFIISHI